MLDPVTAGVVIMVLLLGLLALGVHIGVALGLGGLAGMAVTIGPDAALAQLATVPFSATNNFTLAVIPLFILMGALATQAGITGELYKAAYNWLGAVRGGLAMATTLASAAFGAASGSTVVNAAVFTRMALPEMVKFGYDKRLCAGCIAASGTLASLIPPSILMVIYAIITEQSAGKLLLAGLLPGILSAIVYVLGIAVLVRMRPALAPPLDIKISWTEKFNSLKGIWGISLLFFIVIGGIYSGIVVPTYAGAVGAMGAFFIVLFRGRLKRKPTIEMLKDAVITTSTIFIIVIGGMLFARFLTYTGLINEITQTLIDWKLPAWLYLMAFTVLYLILGCFIEPIAIMVMTLPVMYPILTKVGYDPIWLGVISIKLAEISLMTPPVGLNVYVVRSASPVPMTLEEAFQGVYPFLAMDMVTLMILIMFPSISTILPNLMF